MSSTTMSQTPESDGPGPAEGQDGPGPAEGQSRPVRLIQNETTTEIPVHLLFRDEPDPVSVPVGPAAVGRRPGADEQQRQGGLGVRAPPPRAPPARHEGVWGARAGGS
ncbi:hypothetical protein ACFV5G_32185, partial [Streptomyces sp. NPDC059766]